MLAGGNQDREEGERTMGKHHEVVEVDTTADLFRSGPARHYAYCRKDGCRFWWNGIGRLDTYKQQHEALNDTTERHHT